MTQRRNAPLPTWRSEDGFVMADPAMRLHATRAMDAAAQRQWALAEGTRWLAWGRALTPPQRKRVRALRLRVGGDPKQLEVPSVLRNLPSLAFVSMPLALAAKIRPGDLPASVEVLRFDEGHGGAATLDDALVLPSLRSVSAVTGELRFTPANLPNLEAVALRLGARTKMLGVMGSLGALERLDVHPIHGCEAFEALAGTSVTSLGLFGGRIATLSGIGALRHLRELRLKSLPKLFDLAALTSLRHLRSLDVQYCGRVEDLAPLLDVPSMNRLEITGCNRIRLAAVETALRARRWKSLAITGRRHLYQAEGRWVVATK